MATIFLSYSRKDTEIMQKVRDYLRAHDVSVWTDEGIEPGTSDWTRALESNIQRCRGMVVILSPDANASEWVRKEISRARTLGRAVIPLLARGSLANAVPLSLENYQLIDLRTEFDKIQDLLADLERRGWVGIDKIDVEPPLAEVISKPASVDDFPAAPAPYKTNDDIPEWMQGIEFEAGDEKITITKDGNQIKEVKADNPAGIEWIEIPAGEFLYGEKKERKYIRKPYLIGKYPVTNAQYQKFITAKSEYAVPEEWDEKKRTYPPGKTHHPVVYVSWDDAVAFCEWNGCRLPTEQEWEKAARGEDGRTYPWGEDWLAGKYANSEEAGIGTTTPVDDFPEGVSPYGVWDMSGNVWEWTDSWYDDDKDTRVLRGGGWFDFDLLLWAAEFIFVNPDFSYNGFGFRCVLSLS